MGESEAKGFVKPTLVSYIYILGSVIKLSLTFITITKQHFAAVAYLFHIAINQFITINNELAITIIKGLYAT